MTGLGVPAADPAPGEPRAITTIRRAMGAGRQSAITAQNGGSARCYQAIFVPSTALASPGYDGQPAVYLYIAVLEVNVLNCRISRVGPA